MTYFLCYKGLGGLDDALAGKGLAHKVTCGQKNSISWKKLVSFEIFVTKKGFYKMREVVDTFFSFITLFRREAVYEKVY